MTQTIIGLTGRVQWLRRRVWFWQRKAYEASGWRKSPTEGKIRPMMVKRSSLQAERNQFAANAMRNLRDAY